MNWRSIVLWLVLIVAFIAFYQFFAVGGPGHDPNTPAATRVLLPALMVVFFVLFFGVLVVRQRNVNRMLIDAGALLSAGRAHDALAKYEAARKQMPRAPIVRHNLAIANLYLWRVSVAVELLESANAASRWGGQDTRALSLPVLAMANALLGQVDRASQLLPQLGERATLSPFALVARSVLACRVGEWAKAEEMLKQREIYQFGGFLRAVSEVLTAWAAKNLRGEKVVFNRVALYSEAGPDPLRKVWPELADFAEKAG